MKGANHLDWVNFDQIYSTVFEECSSIRHNVILVEDLLCERDESIEAGLGFCTMTSYKRKGKAA